VLRTATTTIYISTISLHDALPISISTLDEPVPNEAITEVTENGNPGFLRQLSTLRNGVFIPKYYDPELEGALTALDKTHNLHSLDRKSTRLNSSHVKISYAVFCLK